MSASLKAKIAEVFDEPGCDKNQAKSEKDRRSGCTKQLTPGAAAGGCAFDGAKIALQPIVDVAHLVHGPIACEGNSWDNRHSASSGATIYRTGFTTDINELDVIYGAEKRLFVAGEAAARRAGRAHPQLHLGRRPLCRGGRRAPRARQHDGVLEVDDQHRHAHAAAIAVFLISSAWSSVLPLTHSVTSELEAMAEPQP